MHGTADTTVPLASSIDFFNKLLAAGVPTALTAIQGAAHAFDNGALDAVEVMAQSIDLFLDRLLVEPEAVSGVRRAPERRSAPGPPAARRAVAARRAGGAAGARGRISAGRVDFAAP